MFILFPRVSEIYNIAGDWDRGGGEGVVRFWGNSNLPSRKRGQYNNMEPVHHLHASKIASYVNKAWKHGWGISCCWFFVDFTNALSAFSITKPENGVILQRNIIPLDQSWSHIFIFWSSFLTQSQGAIAAVWNVPLGNGYVLSPLVLLAIL